MAVTRKHWTDDDIREIAKGEARQHIKPVSVGLTEQDVERIVERVLKSKGISKRVPWFKRLFGKS